MSEHRKRRQRALEYDRMWEAAYKSPPHDTTRVFDEAAAEGFHPVKVAPPNMFAHEEEIRRLPSMQWGPRLEEMRAENRKAHDAIGERIAGVE